MKCPKCHAELTVDSKFCSYCGAAVDSTIHDTEDTIHDSSTHPDPYHMPNSGTYSEKKVDTENSREDTKMNGNEHDSHKTESNDGKRGSYKTQNNKTTREPYVPHIYEEPNSKIEKLWGMLSTFEKIIVVLAALAIAAVVISIITDKTIAGLIAGVQLVLLVCAFLLKRQIIKTSKTWAAIIVLVLAVMLTIPFGLVFKNTIRGVERISWPNIVLSENLPTPESHKGIIHSNSKETLSLELLNCSSAQYYKYVELCKARGFTIDSEESNTSFSAFNSSGYELSLSYYENSKKMTIHLDAAMELESLNWPDGELVKLLPNPSAKRGKIIENSNSEFAVYVDGITIDGYAKYVAQCVESGFSVNKQEGKKNFTAKNADGNKVTVEYRGNNVIYIAVYEPEFDVSIEVKCVANWIFSKYDVKIYVDDTRVDTLDHGTSDTYEMTLKKGVHKVKFESAEDNSLNGEVKIDVNKDESFEFEITCSSFGIDVDTITGTVVEKPTESIETESADTEPTDIELEETEPSNEEEATSKPAEEKKTESVYYSTNDKSAVKNGNSGVYSYKSHGSSYDIYFIIDFDNGYVYYFCDGNGDETCDRVKIDSGDLNDVVIITYHDGDSSWSEGLHFKWKRQPDHLIMQDHKGFEFDFYTTNLKDALALRDSKQIHDY